MHSDKTADSPRHVTTFCHQQTPIRCLINTVWSSGLSECLRVDKMYELCKGNVTLRLEAPWNDSDMPIVYGIVLVVHQSNDKYAGI